MSAKIVFQNAPEFKWLGDGVDSNGSVIVRARNSHGIVYMTIEEVTAKINLFDKVSRNRIISGNAYYTDEVTA